MSRLAPLVLALALLAGCSLDPPPHPELDPELQGRVEEPLRLRLAIAEIRDARIAPITTFDYLAPIAEVGSATEADLARVTSHAQPHPPREYASTLRLDGKRLQRRVGELGAWALGSEFQLVGAAGDELDADLLLCFDLVDARAAWVERGGFLWWADLFMFWGIGALPVVFIPDEVFEVSVEAQFHVVEVRSGRALLGDTVRVSFRETLNHPQRGWSLGGLLWLHPYTLDNADLDHVGRVLTPHALNVLERHLAKRLLEDVRPRVRALLPEIKSGALGPRLHAFVLGSNGQTGGEVALPLLEGADADATQVAAALTARGARVRALTSETATRDELRRELRALCVGVRASDRVLVYFAGFGFTDAEGLPAIVLRDGPLALRPLCDELASLIPAEARVDLVLDASFGAQAGGRTHPGGAELARASLGVLVKDRPWRLICAARPEQTALETSEGGLFTRALLAAAGGAGDADADADGELSLREAWKYTLEVVTSEALAHDAVQGPCIWGGDYDRPLLTIPKPEPAPPVEAGDDAATSLEGGAAEGGAAEGGAAEGGAATPPAEGEEALPVAPAEAPPPVAPPLTPKESGGE